MKNRNLGKMDADTPIFLDSKFPIKCNETKQGIYLLNKLKIKCLELELSVRQAIRGAN